MDDSTAMITATTWVPRGFAAQFPTRKELNDEEIERISQLAQIQLDDAQEDLKDAKEGKEGDSGSDDEMEVDGGVSLSSEKEKKEKKKEKKEKSKEDDELAEYNLSDYDNEDDGLVDGNPLGMFNNIKSLAYYEPGEEDPYITLKDDEDEDEKEELQILATDNLLLATKTEDEIAHLEVYVYEDSDDNLYVHHDIILPAIPLCVEWLDIPPPGSADTSAHGNFAAIGTMDPEIEIWNLDVVDNMYPDAILGAKRSVDKSKKKKKKKKPVANDEHHVDAVLTLASNRQHRNLLASGSADKTLKLWDLNSVKCAKSYNYHTDKVCSLQWHPTEATVLLSGSYDRTVVAADMRAPDAKPPRWGVESDVETVQWDRHDPNYFYITTESGMIHLHDVRNAPATPQTSKPVWLLQAHDGPVSAFDVNPIIPGFIATGGFDKTVKLWNAPTGGSQGPSMVCSRELGVGKVFSARFAPDKEVGFRLAVAGSKGTVQVWDTSTNKAIRSTFAGRVPETSGEEKVIGVEESSDEEDEDEEVEGDVSGEDKEGWESMDEEDA